MPSSESPPRPVSEVIATALDSVYDGNLSALARDWAEVSGSNAESKRRLLYKYLEGTTPEEPSARELASLLKVPVENLLTPRRRASRRDLDAVWEEIGVIHELIADLSRALEP